jgi:hypothetical protein
MNRMRTWFWPLMVSMRSPGPSMVRSLVIFGSMLKSAIVWGEPKTPVVSKSMVLAPPWVLASRTAWRNEPAPESLVFIRV